MHKGQSLTCTSTLLKEKVACLLRITERLWQPEKAVEDLAAQPRLELKRFDAAFFNSILREASAIDDNPAFSNPPTITQQHIWANLQVVCPCQWMTLDRCIKVGIAITAVLC